MVSQIAHWPKYNQIFDSESRLIAKVEGIFDLDHVIVGPTDSAESNRGFELHLKGSAMSQIRERSVSVVANVGIVQI